MTTKFGSTAETMEIAKELWRNPQYLDALIRNLQSMKATKEAGIVYSNQDIDIQSNISALLNWPELRLDQKAWALANVALPQGTANELANRAEEIKSVLR